METENRNYDKEFSKIIEDKHSSIVDGNVCIDDGSLESAVDFIIDNLKGLDLEPESIFDQQELEDWAEGNGYVKEG